MSDASMSDNLAQRGLKLVHLRLLAALGETRQIGLAAGKIGVSQPAASRLLAEVEQIVGSPVHLRTGRGIAVSTGRGAEGACAPFVSSSSLPFFFPAAASSGLRTRFFGSSSGSEVFSLVTRFGMTNRGDLRPWIRTAELQD